MSGTVAELLVDTLQKIGVKQIFGLIGDSLNPLADAVRHSSIEWIGVRHEEGAALAASGQAKLTGKLAVCAGTTGPGSTHLIAGLYEASRDHAPVLALSGDMPRKMHGTDFIQSTEPDLLFRDVSLYTQTITAASQAPGVLREAIAAAYAGRGVAHLTLPQDVLSERIEGSVKSFHSLRGASEVLPPISDVSKCVQLINEAKSVVIMCGAGCQGAQGEIRILADMLKAPIAHSIKGKELFPFDDPHWIGGLGMIGTRPVYNAVKKCDLLLMLGTDYPYPEFLPTNGKVVQIDDRPRVLGRRTETALGLLGSVRPTLPLLINQVQVKTDDTFWREVNARRREWDELLCKQADLDRDPDLIYPQAVARAVSDVADENAVFVLDTGINTLWSGNWIRQTGSQRIVGSFNNAAVGTALGQANGIQALDRSRQVIVLCGDGGFNMLMSEFLTAVHHRLPVKVIVYNNASFGLIPLEAEGNGFPAFREAIEFPNPDFALLARACGGRGLKVAKPGSLLSVIADALKMDGPVIVDCVVDPNEMPNFPHLDLEKIGNFALAKIKETLFNVTGR